MQAIVYALTYDLVLVWDALPDGIHYEFGIFWPWLRFAAWVGYRVYEDGSIGW